MAKYKKSEETKRKILEAASELFYEKGYFDTSIKDICDLSEVSISRVNYHFQTKTNLAAIITKEFLNNFYKGISEIIGEIKEYSLLSDIVQFHFLIYVFMTDSRRRTFYYDMIVDGIFSRLFSEIILEKYKLVNDQWNLQLTLPTIESYAKIYSTAITAIIGGKSLNHVYVETELLQDLYSKMFMQLIDIPHEIQNNFLEQARKYTKSIDFEIVGLTKVNFLKKQM